LAIPAFGEGWHNNHHAFPWSARFGLRWWQIDLGWTAIRTFSLIGLASNLKQPRSNDISERDNSENRNPVDPK
jgi:stearoyl-CoA desaturase (delta-9 desaturase)